MGFSKQECWSGLPFPSAGDLPDPGIEPGSPTLREDALPSEPPGKPVLVCIGTCTIFVIISYLPFMCQKKNNKKTCRESKEVQNIVLLLWIFFFFSERVFIYVPRMLTPKLKYPAQSFDPLSRGWIQAWSWSPCLGQWNPGTRGGKPLSQRLLIAANGETVVGTRPSSPSQELRMVGQA